MKFTKGIGILGLITVTGLQSASANDFAIGGGRGVGGPGQVIRCEVLPGGREICDNDVVRPPSRPGRPGRPVNPGRPIQPGRPLPPIDVPDHREEYGLERFRSLEEEAIYWNDRYRRAQSFSEEERHAARQLEIASQDAIQSLDGGMALRFLSVHSIESFIVEMNGKYQRASSGSLLERMYSRAVTVAFVGFESSVQETARQSRSYQELEQLMLSFARSYQLASSGSAIESGYSKLTRLASQLGLDLLSQEVRYLDRYELRRLDEEFQRKYNQASSGSAIERHYQSALSIVRSGFSR